MKLSSCFRGKFPFSPLSSFIIQYPLNRLPFTGNCLLSTAHCQLPTDNCLLPTSPPSHFEREHTKSEKFWPQQVLEISSLLTSQTNCPKVGSTTMDEDLEKLSREELVSEVKKLRKGIRIHRDSSGHELCWHHPQLWSLLPEKTDPQIEVPEWPQFMRGCIHYRESLDKQRPDDPRVNEEHPASANKDPLIQ